MASSASSEARSYAPSKSYRLPPSSSRPGLSSAGAGGGTGSSSSTVHRRHSLFGTEDRIVLDIGARWSKVGFSGESAPRKVFKTVEATRRPGVDAYFNEDEDEEGCGVDASLVDGELLWDLNLSKGSDSEAVQNRHDLLLAKLTVLLRRVYQEYLMTDPTQRKVILVENPLMPAKIRQHICTVLFDNLRAPMVSPMSAPLLATFATGSATALVVNVGVLETTVMPVYHFRPLVSYFKTSTRAGTRLHRRLRALMLRYARYIEPHSVPMSSNLAQHQQQATSSSLSSSSSTASRTRRVTPEMLTPSVLDEVLVKTCFVSPHRSTLQSHSQGSKSKSSNTQTKVPDTAAGPDWQQSHTGDHEAISSAKARLASYEEADDGEVLASLKSRYTAANSPPTGHLLLPLRDAEVSVNQPLMHDGVSTLPAASSNATLPAFSMPTTGRPTATPSAPSTHPPRRGGDLLIPGWLRAHVADFFFDDEDGDDYSDSGSSSLPSLVLSSLLALPIDLRKTMASSILATGGTASLPGFANRLAHECSTRVPVSVPSSVARATKYSHNIALHTTRVDMRSSSSSSSSSSSDRRNVAYQPLIPLRDDIAVVNDHHPPLAPDGNNERRPSHSAPCIPPLLHAWYGASLLGSLKLSSKDTIRREEWDAQREAEREALRRLNTASVDDADTTPTATATSPRSPPSATRPGAQRRSRGSFMGPAGARGIESGAFGGLEVVARHFNAPRRGTGSGGGGGGGSDGGGVGSSNDPPS